MTDRPIGSRSSKTPARRVRSRRRTQCRQARCALPRWPEDAAWGRARDSVGAAAATRRACHAAASPTSRRLSAPRRASSTRRRLRTRGDPSAFQRAPRRMPRCPRADRPRVRAPARAPCRRRCQGPCPSASRGPSTSASSWRPRLTHRPGPSLSPGRSRAPSPCRRRGL